MNKIILPINEKQTVENYPYGGRRTTAFYHMEFSPKKGFRSVFQTIDPKKGWRNTPKPGIYHSFACHYKNPENGHIEHETLRFYGLEDVNTGCRFLAEHFNTLQLTKEMMVYLYDAIVKGINVDKPYIKGDKTKLAALLVPTYSALTHGIQTGENVFGQINIYLEEIKKLEEEFKNQPDQS